MLRELDKLTNVTRRVKYAISQLNARGQAKRLETQIYGEQYE